jgi:hypothetical protein
VILSERATRLPFGRSIFDFTSLALTPSGRALLVLIERSAPTAVVRLTHFLLLKNEPLTLQKIRAA